MVIASDVFFANNFKIKKLLYNFIIIFFESIIY